MFEEKKEKKKEKRPKTNRTIDPKQIIQEIKDNFYSNYHFYRFRFFVSKKSLITLIIML